MDVLSRGEPAPLSPRPQPVSVPSSPSVPDLLRRSREGDERATGELWSLVYHELHGLAARCMQRQKEAHTLQATALAHEAFLRLAHHSPEGTREDFLALASCAMRSVLVDHARAKQRSKRQLPGLRIDLGAVAEEYEARSLGILELDEALDRLAQIDPPLARIVELRFFGGLTMAEVAARLDMSARTVARQWDLARSWLRKELS